MSRELRLFIGLASLWLLVALGLPPLTLPLPFIAAHAASQSSAAQISLAELGCLVLGAWAWARLKPGALFGLAAWLWSLATLWGLARGLGLGWGLKNILGEARWGLLALALPLMSVWARHSRASLELALWGGLGLRALWHLALLALEPSGASNLNVTPLPVVSVQHELQLWSALGLALLFLQARRGASALAVAVLLWPLVWLSYLRALWVTLPLSGLALALGLGAWVSWREASLSLARQLMAAAISLLLVLGLLGVFSPDSAYLLQFRITRTAQALGLGQDLRATPASPRHSAQLRLLIERGGLYVNVRALGKLPQAHELEASRRQDESRGDRRVMAEQARTAWREAPWLGQGLGAWRERPQNQGRSVMRDPHQGALFALGKLGILGSLLCLLALALVAAPLWGAGGKRRAGLLAGAAYLALNEGFQVSFLSADLALLWAAALAWGRPQSAKESATQADSHELLRRLRALAMSLALRLAFGLWRGGRRASDVRRVYLVELTRLGDLVSATALIEPLRQAYPEARVHVVADQAYAGLFEGDERVVFLGLAGKGKAFLRDAWALRGLWSGPDSLMVLASPSLRSQLLLLFSRPGRASGYLFPSLGGLGYDEKALAYSAGPAGRAVLGASDAADHLVIRAGRAYFGFNAMSRLSPLLLSATERRSKRVVLHAGANWSWRRWPLERFVELARGLNARGYETRLIAAEAQGEQPGDLSWVKPGGLAELRDLLASAELFIGNDSGPMHLAAALGTPCLAFFGPNLPERSGPWPLPHVPGSPHRALEGEVECRPCGQLTCVQPQDWCMAKIEVSQALSSALSILTKR